MQTAPPPCITGPALELAKAALEQDRDAALHFFAKTWTAARDHDRKRTVDGDAVEVGQ